MSVSFNTNPTPLVGNNAPTVQNEVNVDNTGTVSPGQLAGSQGVTTTEGPHGTSGDEQEILLDGAKDERSDLSDVTAKMLMPLNGGFNMQKLFAELMDVGKTLKQVSKIDREFRVNQVESEAKQAAADIRSGAAFALAATLVSSTAQIAGGAISLAGAGASQKAFDNKMEAIAAKSPDVSAQQMGDMARQAATLAQAPYQFGSTLVGESGKMVGAGLQMGSQFKDASRAEHQAKSAKEQSLADTEGDYKQAAEKLIASVLDKMSEMQRAMSQTESNIARMG